MGTRGLALIGLTLLTAGVHLGVGLGLLDHEAEPLLTVNGVGYLVLLALWMRTPAWLRPGWLRALFLVYTLATLVGYFALDGLEALEDPLGMFTKGLEIGLFLLLLGERPATAASVSVQH